MSGTKTIAARILDGLHIAYEVREYPVDADHLDAVTVAAKVGMPPERVFKTLVLRGDRTGLIMACIPAGAELETKALAALSGNKRVELVPVKDLPTLTGYQRGGVSPLGGKKRCPVYIDASAQTLDQVSVSAGQRGAQLLLSGPDLIAATQATPGALTRP